MSKIHLPRGEYSYNLGSSYIGRNSLFFLFYLLWNPRLIRLAFKKIYLPVYVQFEWLKRYKISTIIDIGASKGHITKVLHYLFPEAIIYAFEPIEEEIEKIRSKIQSKNLILENVALSNKNGAATFYRHKYTPASSMLPLLSKYKKKFKNVSKAQKLTVKTITLDSYFKNKKLKDLIFLKIDTQGTEKIIFEGGQNFLKNVSIIHVETSFVGLYENQSFFTDIYNYLTTLGFQYMGNVIESHFYPFFAPSEIVNSVFARIKD